MLNSIDEAVYAFGLFFVHSSLALTFYSVVSHFGFRTLDFAVYRYIHYIHFNSPLHTINNLRITPTEQIDSTDTSELLRREQFWMNTLYTKYPNGLNYYALLYN